MLAGSVSDLQRIMDRLTMVSVNYNMKINTKKTNVLRVSKGSESAMKIVFAEEIIEQVRVRVKCGMRNAECGKYPTGKIRKILCGTFPIFPVPHFPASTFRIPHSAEDGVYLG